MCVDAIPKVWYSVYYQTSNTITFIKYTFTYNHMSLWRNWLARSAVNRKVGGSSPPRDGFFKLIKLN